MASTHVTAWLGLGSNQQDPASQVHKAVEKINADANIDVVEVSSLYVTPPWGDTQQPDFVNAVAKVDTGLKPEALLVLAGLFQTTIEELMTNPRAKSGEIVSPMLNNIFLAKVLNLLEEDNNLTYAYKNASIVFLASCRMRLTFCDDIHSLLGRIGTHALL